jgi:heme exporter protein D
MNWSEFFSMGGYAFYVWGSYLATLILMGGEVVLLLRRRKASRHQSRSSSGAPGKVITNETSS